MKFMFCRFAPKPVQSANAQLRVNVSKAQLELDHHPRGKHYGDAKSAKPEGTSLVCSPLCCIVNGIYQMIVGVERLWTTTSTTDFVVYCLNSEQQSDMWSSRAADSPQQLHPTSSSSREPRCPRAAPMWNWKTWYVVGPVSSRSFQRNVTLREIFARHAHWLRQVSFAQVYIYFAASHFCPYSFLNLSKLAERGV